MMSDNSSGQPQADYAYNNVKVEFDDGIAWVILNRPDKRNAMSPSLNREMGEVLRRLEVDDRCGVLILTGAGEAFSAGMDLKEYFRENEGVGRPETLAIKRDAYTWQWRHLKYFFKPTIAMVNGWCFGGAFTPLVSCDIALADEKATFGLSEINWGIIPGGNVMKAVASKMSQSDGLYYVLTGETFDGRKAAEMGLVKEALPADRLRERTVEIARKLLKINPILLHGAKECFHGVNQMDWHTAEDYNNAKVEQAILHDTERGMKKGLEQFLDKKSFRPGLSAYDRNAG
jgi:trans-feruloyl-CoA hydratase/vanillin synthase